MGKICNHAVIALGVHQGGWISAWDGHFSVQTQHIKGGEEFTIEEHGDRVALRVHQGGWISCWDGSVSVQTKHVKDGELWHVEKISKGVYAFKSHQGKYLSAWDGRIGCSDHCKGGEQFKLVLQKKGEKSHGKFKLKGGKVIALQSYQGSFLSNWDNHTGCASKLQGGETFTLVDCGNGKFGLKSYQGNFVSAWDGRVGSAGHCQGGEQFEFQHLGGNKFALKVYQGGWLNQWDGHLGVQTQHIKEGETWSVIPQ
jgi:hypothetical protein